jgi:hypothetical protein
MKFLVWGNTLTDALPFTRLVRFVQRNKKKNKLHGQSPRANYTDRATAACRWSDCQLLRIKDQFRASPFHSLKWIREKNSNTWGQIIFELMWPAGVTRGKINSVTWVRERTIPIEWLPLVSEVSAFFCGLEGDTWLAWRIPMAVFSAI